MVVLSLTNFADNNAGKRKLIITIPENLNYTNAFDNVFNKFLVSNELTKVKTTNMGTMFELTYLVEFSNNVNEKEFIDALRVMNENLNITLGVVDNTSGALN